MTVASIPNREDFIWLEFTPQTGGEQAGRRPASVMTPKAYIAEALMALFCPVSSPVKGYPFELVLPEGSEVIGVVLADQLKSLGWPARKGEADCGSILCASGDGYSKDLASACS